MPDPYHKFINFYDLLIEPIVGGSRQQGLRLYPPLPGLLVLDVGCGTGSQLALYQKAGCRVYGVDKSPAMLETARSKLGPSANLTVEDASSLHFPDGMFDLVTLSLSLHELQPAQRKAVLEECVRVLKPKGKILIIEFNVENFGGFLGWFRKLAVGLVESSAGKEHFSGFRQFTANGGLKSVLKDHPLTVEKQISSGNGVFAIYLIGR